MSWRKHRTGGRALLLGRGTGEGALNPPPAELRTIEVRARGQGGSPSARRRNQTKTPPSANGGRRQTAEPPPERATRGGATRRSGTRMLAACKHTLTSAIYGASCTSAIYGASVGWWVGFGGFVCAWVCACVWVCVREVFCGLAAVFTGLLVDSNWKFDGGTTVPPLVGGVSPAGICREWWCGRVRRWLCGH